LLADRKLKKSGEDKRGTSMSYIAMTHHLKEYSGNKTTFKQINKNYCQGFVEYLKTAVNANNRQRLSANTQWEYSDFCMINRVLHIKNCQDDT